MNELVDWFGKDFSILLEERRDGRLLISLKCNENAFFYWALQFGLSVEVLEPEGLRGRIAQAVEIMNEKYHSKD
jgi:predicted DNA-binding transcriptional regulator YafY